MPSRGVEESIWLIDCQIWKVTWMSKYLWVFKCYWRRDIFVFNYRSRIGEYIIWGTLESLTKEQSIHEIWITSNGEERPTIE